MTISEFKEVAAILGAVVGLLTLLKGVVEYIKQGTEKRAELFLMMRKRLKDNDSFQHICALLDSDAPALLDVPFQDKRDFLGLFEDVAIAMNSGLIKPSVVHYMFGYYAIKCQNSQHFWNGAKGGNRDSIYWKVFNDFAKNMVEMETSFQFRRSQFRF